MSFIQQELYNNASSLSNGLLFGGKVTINPADNTKFDIEAGACLLVDNSNVVKAKVKIIRWTKFTALTPEFIATSESSFIGMGVDGNLEASVIQQPDEFTQLQKRTITRLAGLGHPDNVTIVVADFSPGNIAFNTDISFNDLVFTLRPINFDGNEYDFFGNTLEFKKSTGSSFRFGSNFETDSESAHLTEDPALDPISLYFYVYRDGAGDFAVDIKAGANAVIDPNFYDDGTGILATMPTKKYQNQRIFFTNKSNLVFIQIGQKVYNSRSDALLGRLDESFEINPPLVFGSVFRGWLTVREGATDLSDSIQAIFTSTNRFGNIDAHPTFIPTIDLPVLSKAISITGDYTITGDEADRDFFITADATGGT